MPKNQTPSSSVMPSVVTIMLPDTMGQKTPSLAGGTVISDPEKPSILTDFLW
jgi:hypothetical protein